MGEGEDPKFIFPLTGLQIGDMQAYLSDLSLFLATESNKLYILVDNRPWLRDFVSRPAHIWQLMVTKSRLSPFANSKAQRQRRASHAVSQSIPSEKDKREAWYKLIAAATLSKNKMLHPMKELRNSLFLSNELHRTLSGFIIFEVVWANVRGINYLNELQTDTSMVIESKIMQRWEFDSVTQAASCLPLWFPGTSSEQLRLKEFLHSSIGEIFYDAKEPSWKMHSIVEDESVSDGSQRGGNGSLCYDNRDNKCDKLFTPPPTGPYKRRRVTKAFNGEIEVEDSSDESLSASDDSSDDDVPVTPCANNNGNAIDAKQYKDVLILLRFNDHDLPFKLADVIMSDLRLLTLLEAGLPSWVIFLQSYPGFRKLYRPWMCPLARVLYVVISFITVIIGFYDLYKNVPLLKATASRLCGPLFDWIETWDMASRIQYLGTMLFLHNFEKAVTWFLHVTRTTRSFLTVLTQPLIDPFLESLEFILPVWNILVELIGGLLSAIWLSLSSTFSLIEDLTEIILTPLWLIISLLSSFAFTILYPIFWVVWEVLYAPIRLVLACSSLITFVSDWTWNLIADLWISASSLVRLASASEAAVTTYEVSIWRSLWNDLFSQIFRAVRSILNGLVAFFAACNRHRLSIYNYILDFTRRMLGRPRYQPSIARNSRKLHGSRRTLSQKRREIRVY